jgi:hypothetical protein
MKKYIVTVDSNGSESAFFGFMFKNAVIEFVKDDGENAVYEIESEIDLENALNDSDGVVEFSTVS